MSLIKMFRNSRDTSGRNSRDTSGRNSCDTSGRNSRDTSGRNSRDTSGGNSRDTSGRNPRNTSVRNSRDTSGRNSRDTSGRNSRNTSSRNSRDTSGRNYFPAVFAFQHCFYAVCNFPSTCNGTRSSLAEFCALFTTYLFDLLSIDFSLEMSGNTIWKASRFSRIIKNTVDQVERGVGVNFFLHTRSSRPGSTRPNWNGDK